MQFSRLKPNISKCESLCGLKFVDLTVDTISILGVHFFVTIRNIQNILRLWNSKNCSLEGRIIIFKILAISKIAYLSLLIDVPNTIINEIQSIRKNFFSIKNKSQNTFDEGGPENADDNIKIISLQCSWNRKLYVDNFHE